MSDFVSVAPNLELLEKVIGSVFPDLSPGAVRLQARQAIRRLKSLRTDNLDYINTDAMQLIEPTPDLVDELFADAH